MNVVKPSWVHERIATTRMSRLIAPAMVRAPSAGARACAPAGGGAESRGSTAVSSAAARNPGTSMPRLPLRPKPVRSAVISGGPRGEAVFEAGGERGHPRRPEGDADVAAGGEDGHAGGLALPRHRGRGAVALGVIRGDP